MKKYFYTPLAIFLVLTLMGAKCQKEAAKPKDLSGYPEACKGEDLPDGFPEDLLYPDYVAISASEVGMEAEKASTGEAYEEKQEGFMGSFCSKATVEEILDWYEKALAEQGYTYLGEYDQDYAYEKGQTMVTVSAYELEEGFRLFSFNTMTRNY